MSLVDRVYERQKERRNGILRKREEKLLGEAEGGRSDGEAGDGDSIIESVRGEIELFEGDLVGD